jgi:hypothetical protein
MIKIDGNEFWIRDDIIPDIRDLFIGSKSVNVRYFIQLKNINDTYIIDMGRMMTDNPELLYAENIFGVINMITPNMLYTFQTNYFNFAKIIRSFTSDDLKYPIRISPYSIAADDESNLTDDPSHSDIVIRCDSFSFDNVFPVIGDKLRRCRWADGKIFIENSVELVPNTLDFNFISFGECEIEISSISDIAANGWHIPEGYVPIIVLYGSMYYDDEIYTFSRANRILSINNHTVIRKFRSYGFTTADELYADSNSFVILVKCDNIFIRNVPVTRLDSDCSNIMICYERDIHNHHVDYIGIDSENIVRGLTVVDERYKNIHSNLNPLEHHIYINTINSNMRIIQLLAC